MKVNLFKYFFTKGYARNADIRYELEFKDNKYFATIKHWGIPEEEATILEVDESFEKKLEEILKKYNVSSWDGFQKSDKHVLDGNSFDLYIKMEEENNIDASGYMKWPKNYREFKQEVIELFDGLTEKNN